MENNKPKLNFILGEETRPKIEPLDKVTDSIFSKQYKQALECIANFINNTMSDNTRDYNTTQGSDSERFMRQQNYNNIFVFIGDRGSGKTSCMLTVHKIIIQDMEELRKKHPDFLDAGTYNILSRYKFHSCGTVDPTLFDNKHNVLELFIGTLFKEFSSPFTQKDSGPLYSERHFDYNTKSRMIEAFQEAKEHLSLLNKKKDNIEYEDPLQEIHDLTAATDIKNSIDNLIDCYLKYQNGACGKQTTKLVLSIDDIDLNMSNAYVMIEQIRKYLTHPNLIILMAVKMGQLANVVRINYYNEFKSLLKQEHDNKGTGHNYKETINEIVERYMLKLFATNQRIYLPDIEELVNSSIQIKKYDDKENLVDVEDNDNEPFKDKILEIIYKKIRMLFYNTSQKTSYIIPRNLRELLNLTALLYKLEDVSSHEGANANLPHFKKYFNEIWCKNNLDEEGLQIIQRLGKTRDAVFLNKTTIQLLSKRFDRKDEQDGEIQNITKPSNVMYNISLGDVLAYLDWLDKVCYEDYDMKLLFAIKTFYSFKLYESFQNKNKDENIVNLTREEQETLVVLNQNQLTWNKTEYEDILSGNFLNSEYINAAPKESNTSRSRKKETKETKETAEETKDSINPTSRSRRIINIKTISELLNIYKEENKNEKEENKDKNIRLTIYTHITTPQKESKAVKITTSKKVKELQENLTFQKIIEFFMLTTSFVVDANANKTPDNHRTERKIYYRSSITANRKEACFDILSILYNLLNAEKAYSRFEAYNNKALNWHSPSNNNGLYASILKDIKLNEKIQKRIEAKKETTPLTEEEYEKIKAEAEEEELRYRIHVRNMELLEQISFLLELKRSDGSRSNIKVLRRVFDNLSKFKIVISSENDITFDFFKEISNFLNELKDPTNIQHYEVQDTYEENIENALGYLFNAIFSGEEVTVEIK